MLIKAKRSSLARGAHRSPLFAQLVDRLQLFLQFEIDNHTGEPLHEARGGGGGDFCCYSMEREMAFYCLSSGGPHLEPFLFVYIVFCVLLPII